jgi:hypothetical protein
VPRPADFLRQNREGVLLADGVPFPVRFVIDGATGRLVLPVPPPALAASEHVLWVPEESDDALQLLVAPAEIDPAAEPACDRWLAGHGTPPWARWAAFTIEAGRAGGEVADAPELTLLNPLRDAEGRLCRRLNRDRDALRRAANRVRGVDIADPAAVGVDPWGADLRARFGIVRLPFPAPAPTEEEAAAAIDALLAPGDDGGA